MDNPVRKMVQFNPQLLSMLKQLSKQTGLDPDQLVNLALWDLGKKFGLIKANAKDIAAPTGAHKLSKARPSRAKQTLPPPPRASKGLSAQETMYMQVDEGPISPIIKDVFLIGRGSKCDHIIHHRSVSREHAVITHERTGWYIEDLNSANGTWLNGEQVSKHRIRSGEEFTISNHVIRLNLRSG